ncbi:hypothetical protein STP4a_059 [Salmonella phage STP4-a]|uniref:Uncharacterized protein n=1 Tax=Salmonella phage STP4-a TaxID=1445860 RepID=A0A0B4L978_9CAUD|nr:hypothetical protein STP4a_059 [Salmonella phage STP4-a]AHJ86914.1 hypothetical protein STP4a_059 [Salmonella phage STP4-a]UFK27186.1 hypothetical protein LG358_00165 [Escherichia phage UoN_LG358_1]
MSEFGEGIALIVVYLKPTITGAKAISLPEQIETYQAVNYYEAFGCLYALGKEMRYYPISTSNTDCPNPATMWNEGLTRKELEEYLNE